MAISAQVADIIKSGAKVWLAPVGEALPDINTAAGADWGGNWVRLGITSAPIALKYEVEEAELEIEEMLAVAKRINTKESLAIETKMAEFTAANMSMLTGSNDVVATAPGAGQVGYDEIELGGEICAKAEYALGLEGVACSTTGDNLPIRFFIYRVTMKLNGDIEFSRKNDEFVGLPLRADALGSLAETTFGKLGKLQRVTAPATS